MSIALLLFHLQASADTGCGGIVMSADTCSTGDVVEATVCVDAIEVETYEWRSDELEFDEVDGASVSFTCPDVECPGDGFIIYVVAMDAGGQQVWAFEDIEVSCVSAEDKDCGGCASSAALVPVALLAGGLGRRRRGSSSPPRTRSAPAPTPPAATSTSP